MFYVSAIALGLLGSFHCVGMCGPIALSLPLNESESFHKHTGILLYNAGRTITYALFGLIFGTIGQTFYFFGLQQVLSVVIGSLILISLLLTSAFIPKNKLSLFVEKKLYFVKTKLMYFLHKKGLISVFSIGILNGMLPCGLVYMAIAGSLTASDFKEGMFYMFLFGVSTIPVMYSLSLFSNIIQMSFKKQVTRFIPIAIGVMAILLILRGLNLGIPYLSPKIEKQQNICLTQNNMKCHK